MTKTNEIMSFKTAESFRSPNPLKPLFGDTMSTIIFNSLNLLTKLISRGDFATNAIEEVQETYGLTQEQDRYRTHGVQHQCDAFSEESHLTLTICLKNASSP